MIQSIIPTYYQLRGSEKAIVQIEISSFVQTDVGVTYTVTDYALISEGVKQMIHEKTVSKTNAEINDLNVMLESMFDYTGLSKTEAEWKKIQQALLLDTQTNLYPNGTTIHKILPSDWELCPAAITPEL